MSLHVQPARHRRRSVRQIWQTLVRRWLWGMDIAPSAWIASTALIDRTWPRGVHIGPDVMIDEEVVLLTHDLTRGMYVDTRVGAGTIVGARAIILPGITVGDHCVIAPGSLVNRDMPARSRCEGNPMTLTTVEAA